MKKHVHVFFLLLISPLLSHSQITTPTIKANFGVDGDVRANYYNGAASGSGDDWFINGIGTGLRVIDTTGAAARVAGYNTDVSPWPKRMASFYAKMSKPQLSNVNHRIWYDAIFVRDYHGNDTTVFASGSSKNGMSPANWNCPVAQAIPDKNDILDVFMHIRRNGDGTVAGVTDSLWLFGGVSMDNTTGNRYFDFEMFQTDIYYDRASLKWYGYGPDAGHTSWQFDAAGNVIKPGDIIFSGEFQSSTLTNIEARIWVSQTDWLTVAPTAFNWSGFFDGASAGSTFGYASISPKTAAAFYTGLGSLNNTWAGPFGLVLQDNSLSYTAPAPATTTNSKYVAVQFIEFSVNLTQLGLDPVSTFGGDICGTPFNRVVVKTRASASFTSELKDFVAPTDLFLAPRVDILTETPYICDAMSTATIYVTNPLSTSVYQWSTTDGNIIGTTTGTSINVDHSGTYVVTQYLQSGCSPYATDTVVINAFSPCSVLANNMYGLKGEYKNDNVNLDWKVLNNQAVLYFDVERSTDGVNFTSIGRISRDSTESLNAGYQYSDNSALPRNQGIYYRIKLYSVANTVTYSNVVRIFITGPVKNTVTIGPNPVVDVMQVQVSAATNSEVKIDVIDQAGKLVLSSKSTVQCGNNTLTIDGMANYPRGIYVALVSVGNELFKKKILLMH